MHFEQVLAARLIDQLDSAQVCPVGPIDFDGEPPIVVYRRGSTDIERNQAQQIRRVTTEIELIIFARKAPELWPVRDEIFEALDTYTYPTTPGSGTPGQFRFLLWGEYQDLELDLDRFVHNMLFRAVWHA